MDARLSDLDRDASRLHDSSIQLIHPLQDAPATARLSARQRGLQRRTGADRTVLLVEDSPGDVGLIEILARARGFAVKHTLTAAAARERLQRGCAAEVVLLDLRLPDAQPMADVRSILRAAGSIPVVVLTGLDDEDVATRCIDLGAQDYICRSDLTEDVLCRAIEHAITRRRAAELTRRVRSTEAASLQPARRRVLIVDDDAWVRRSITRLLAPTHEVVELAGGAAAIELLSRDRRFDAVLCDLTMPGVDGAAVCAAIAKADRAFLMRVVILTGGSFTAELHAYAESHPGSVVAKPARRQDLLEAIERVAQQCGELPPSR